MCKSIIRKVLKSNMGDIFLVLTANICICLTVVQYKVGRKKVMG